MTIKEELEEIKSFFKWITSKIFGKVYDEIALYVMSMSFIMILFFDDNLISDLEYLSRTDSRFYFIYAGILIGILFSIYHAFSKKKKTVFAKGFMLHFALSLQLIVAMIALFYAINDDEVSLLFPLLNYLYIIIMYKLDDYDSLELYSVSDRNAEYFEILIATTLVGIVVLLSIFLFRFQWIETLSISILLGNQLSAATHKLGFYFLTPFNK